MGGFVNNISMLFATCASFIAVSVCRILLIIFLSEQRYTQSQNKKYIRLS